MRLLIFISLLLTACSSLSKFTDEKPSLSSSSPSVQSSSLGDSSDICDYTATKNGQPKLSEADLLFHAVEAGCPTQMDAILKNEKEDDVYKAMSEFIKKADVFVVKLLQNMKGKAEDDPETPIFAKQIKSVKVFDDFLKDRCKGVADSPDACKAKIKFNAFTNRFQKKANLLIAEENREAEVERKKALANDPENKFKMKFCKKSNLFSILFIWQGPIKSDCIYSLASTAGRLYVIQSTKDGVLVSQSSQILLAKTIFIRTKIKYADGDLIQDQLVKSAGLMKYISVAGAQKTVNAFQYLMDGVHSDDEEEDYLNN